MRKRSSAPARAPRPGGSSPRPAASRGSVPISEAEASDDAIAGSFQAVKTGAKPAGRQAEFESRWDAAAVRNYAEAKALAGEGADSEVAKYAQLRAVAADIAN